MLGSRPVTVLVTGDPSVGVVPGSATVKVDTDGVSVIV